MKELKDILDQLECIESVTKSRVSFETRILMVEKKMVKLCAEIKKLAEQFQVTCSVNEEHTVSSAVRTELGIWLTYGYKSKYERCTCLDDPHNYARNFKDAIHLYDFFMYSEIEDGKVTIKHSRYSTYNQPFVDRISKKFKNGRIDYVFPTNEVDLIRKIKAKITEIETYIKNWN